ncbi:acid phosphatase [Methylocapsa palsarum]|uniref:Acid phosphatase n=1 Tax=Methylocapsa palsarum TaxID=1612308 RepID=A0A1I3XHR1_9HYPH|nr:acid phosphatase [Methylocapsa palsarum]SFK18879.1 acid phosphatase [Methylocapsa palsarum]
MNKGLGRAAAVAGIIGAIFTATAGVCAFAGDLDKIENIVVLYAENRSFDNLYGAFPGANGLANVSAEAAKQADRDGSPLPRLPPIWGGLTAPGASPVVTEAQTRHMPNAPFALDDPKGLDTPLSVATIDLVHRFYQNQMQINGGKNDRFVAYGDTGALVMGHYDGSKLPLWKVAQRYALADNFFMAAFGGSFVNHFYLACACEPEYPNADQSPAKGLISAVEPDGTSLSLVSNSPGSALEGVPKFVNDGTITPGPRFYAVNTMQPPYQPSRVKPARGGDPAYADPGAAFTLPPQTEPTIGGLLSAKGVTWAWYAGAWKAALADSEGAVKNPAIRFQTHHQPYNYFAPMAPGTAARAEHLRDGGLNGAEFIKAIDAGALPQVSFYKPQGSLNEHPGYAEVLSGDEHLAEIVAHLEKSPQWGHMVVIVTYDENGGFWDHVPPPKGDRWGPGTRIPALIISPFAKKGHVDHTLYDTTSILRFITRRFDLPVLSGLSERDAAMAGWGEKLGDLTPSLDLTSP